MHSRIALLTLLLLPGRSSMSQAERGSAVVNASDIGLAERNGVLYHHGERFNGRLLAHAENGALIADVAYRHGLRDGTSDAWYQNGQHWFHRSYRAGREDGEHRGWWPDGRLHFVYQYRDGVSEGVAREWFPSGVLYREFHYDRGQEAGSQRMWYGDGQLRANYVTRNGRRFGLPGTKGCIGLDTTVVIP